MISVIICTYNRERYIFNVLKSIADGELPHSEYEIVLVDNNCTDNTRSESKRFVATYPDIRFRYLIETNQGLSYARNCGIRNSSGDILVYVDDDALVNPQYLRTYSDFFARNATAVAAGGPILPQYDGCEEPQWMSHYTRQLITGRLYLSNKERLFPKNAFPGGGNAAYRRDVFDKVGLFNVELGRKGDSLIGAEEKDLFDKMTTLGMTFYYLPDAILYHLIPPKKLTRDYFDRLTISIGRSERMRTQSIGKSKFAKRLLSEAIKWCASIVLCIGFTLTLKPSKGWKLIQFRCNVTKGLLGK